MIVLVVIKPNVIYFRFHVFMNCTLSIRLLKGVINFIWAKPLQTMATFHCFEINEFSFYSISCYGLTLLYPWRAPWCVHIKYGTSPLPINMSTVGHILHVTQKWVFSHLLQKDSNCMNLKKMLFTFTKWWDWTSCDIQGSVVNGTSNQTKPKIFWVFLFHRRSLTNL